MSCKIKMTHYLLALNLALLGCSSAPSVSAEAPTAVSEVDDVEPEAGAILKQMSDYLASIQTFEMTGGSSIESVLDSGQKIMLDFSNKIVMRRPSKLFSSRIGEDIDQRFFYDGKSFTLYSAKDNAYASIAAPDTVSKTLDFALAQFNLTAPGIDLLHKNSYERLSNALLSGFYVGKSQIDGVECHHLAFRNTEVDWQIWIQTGDKPLPKKYIITSRWITSSPQYTTTMNWNLTPDFSENMFNFVAPNDVKKVDSINALPRP
ncbi:MAG: DUF2092 domain-containing protein [Methyloprofundus sp.]|nr:DUF2092 domain-containing protein [Methyloprofundus sp.]